MLFALWPLHSGRFMPWQVVSYAFLHGDFLHLFFNMLGLWMFGAELERLWGQQRYWQFLLASVLAAAATQLLITWLTRLDRARRSARRARCSACCWPSACCSRTASSCRCSRRSR